MYFHVDPHNEIPIYIQVINQIKHSVASGMLATGARLPSVRKLAAELVVNPNTIARAYQELEREGIISTVQGRGTFVAKTQQKLLYEERMNELQPIIRRLLVEAYHLDVELADVRRLVDQEIHKFALEGEEY